MIGWICCVCFIWLILKFDMFVYLILFCFIRCVIVFYFCLICCVGLG